MHNLLPLYVCIIISNSLITPMTSNTIKIQLNLWNVLHYAQSQVMKRTNDIIAVQFHTTHAHKYVQLHISYI